MKKVKKLVSIITVLGVLGTASVVYATTGKTDEFKSKMLEQKKTILDQRVKDGTLTKEKADEVYNAIKKNQATCDGTGSARIGQKYGVGFGRGNGMGKGQGKGQGQGVNRGRGAGNCNGTGIGANTSSNK